MMWPTGEVAKAQHANLAHLAWATLLAAAPPTWANAAIETDWDGNQAVPWTSLAANDDDADFHFVIVSDRTGGARPGVFESAMPR